MRALGVVLGLVACSSPPPAEVPARPATPRDATAAPVDTAWAADPDNDSVLGACDLCPTEPETSWSAAAHNHGDGCAETQDEVDRVAADPRVQYSGPLYLTGGGTTISGPWQIPEEVETLACIGVGANEGVAMQRANTLCASVEQALKATGAKVTLARYARIRQKEDQYILQVMRASGIDVYRWTTDLERVTPRPMVGRPMVEGCEWLGFYTNSLGEIRTCVGECKGTTSHSYLAIWPPGTRDVPPGKPPPPRDN